MKATDSALSYNDHIEPTHAIIRVGFNVSWKGQMPKRNYRMYSADFELVRYGRASLSESQVSELLNSEMAVAVRCASWWLLSVWSRMSEEQQSAVVDMHVLQYGVYTCMPITSIVISILTIHILYCVV